MGGRGRALLLELLGFCAMHCATIVFLFFFPLPQLHFLLKGVWETVVRWCFFSTSARALWCTQEILGGKGFTIFFEKNNCKITNYSPYVWADVPVPLPEAKTVEIEEKKTYIPGKPPRKKSSRVFSLLFFLFLGAICGSNFHFLYFPLKKERDLLLTLLSQQEKTDFFWDFVVISFLSTTASPNRDIFNKKKRTKFPRNVLTFNFSPIRLRLWISGNFLILLHFSHLGKYHFWQKKHPIAG